MGLNMIVEADLNYEKDRKVKAMSNNLRKQIRGNFTNSDNEHVFYKPKEVLWINLWLNRVAIASVVITILISIPEFDRMKRIILPYFMGIMEWGFVSLLIASVIAGFAIVIQCLLFTFR